LAKAGSRSGPVSVSAAEAYEVGMVQQVENFNARLDAQMFIDAERPFDKWG
jgi:hypothetical protein